MSKKNVVWWPAVINPEHDDKYGGYDYFKYSRNSWEAWCNRNDVLFVPFEEPIEKDLHKFRVNCSGKGESIYHTSRAVSI